MSYEISQATSSVLIVENDFGLLETVTVLFERAGLRVLSASNGEAALTLLRDQGTEVDWLYTDVNLPGLVDGWAVAATYRKQHPFRPVIYASAARCGERRQVPGSVFIEKPVQPLQILALSDAIRQDLLGHEKAVWDLPNSSGPEAGFSSQRRDENYGRSRPV